MYPVFQQTLLTPETSAIVLELEKAEEKSRKIWKDVDDLFKKSIYHKNNKSNMLTDINNHRWPLVKWTGTYTAFILELETLIINYDQVAEDGERFTAERKKEALKQAIVLLDNFCMMTSLLKIQRRCTNLSCSQAIHVV